MPEVEKQTLLRLDPEANSNTMPIGQYFDEFPVNRKSIRDISDQIAISRSQPIAIPDVIRQLLHRKVVERLRRAF
jgi:hypothetical protein